MKNYILILLSAVHLNLYSQQKDLVNYANTLQGTNSEFSLSAGNTYPTTALPFGMHTWSAQTGKNGDGWKYSYKDKTIRGFQQAHQCSPWMNDYAVLALMPVAGELKVGEDERATAFSHANEIAKPHYYKVTLDNQISTEISPTERGAHLRFTFPKGDKSYVVIDGNIKESSIEIIPSQRRIIGWVNNGRFVPEGFKSFFVIEFDKPFKAYGTWDNVSNKTSLLNQKLEGKGAGAFIQFRDGETVQAKVASSYISQDQALVTFKRELDKFKNVDQTKSAAAAIWNK
ncbi:MAG: glycoside hydrolase family 92 protein, partial [Sphingobacteriaceae bacterium]